MSEKNETYWICDRCGKKMKYKGDIFEVTFRMERRSRWMFGSRDVVVSKDLCRDCFKETFGQFKKIFNFKTKKSEVLMADEVIKPEEDE